MHSHFLILLPAEGLLKKNPYSSALAEGKGRTSSEELTSIVLIFLPHTITAIITTTTKNPRKI